MRIKSKLANLNEACKDFVAKMSLKINAISWKKFKGRSARNATTTLSLRRIDVGRLIVYTCLVYMCYVCMRVYPYMNDRPALR